MWWKFRSATRHLSPLPAFLIFTSSSRSRTPPCAFFTRKRQSWDAQQDEGRGERLGYLTWRSARRSRSDAEVWTSPPVASEPAAGRAGLWTPRPTRSRRSPGGGWTGARRSSPSCWAVKRTERRRLRPRCSSCRLWVVRTGRLRSYDCGERTRAHRSAPERSRWRRSLRARRTWTKGNLLPGGFTTGSPPQSGCAACFWDIQGGQVSVLLTV